MSTGLRWLSCLNGLDCQYFMTGVDKKDFELLVDGMALSNVPHGTWGASEG